MGLCGPMICVFGMFRHHMLRDHVCSHDNKDIIAEYGNVKFRQPGTTLTGQDPQRIWVRPRRSTRRHSNPSQKEYQEFKDRTDLVQNPSDLIDDLSWKASGTVQIQMSSEH